MKCSTVVFHEDVLGQNTIIYTLGGLKLIPHKGELLGVKGS